MIKGNFRFSSFSMCPRSGPSFIIAETDDFLSEMRRHILRFITARKPSLRSVCFYRCLSVHGGGGMRGCRGGACAVTREGHARLLGRGMRGCWGACMVAGGCVVAGGLVDGGVWL